MSFPIQAAALGLATFAPIITKWFGGGKGEGIAEKIVTIAQEVTGADNPVDAVQRLHGDATLAQAFQLAVLKAEAEIEVALVKDRQDARRRDIGISGPGRSNRRADIMIAAAGLGLFLCVAPMAFFCDKLPGEAIGIISTIAGIFGACFKDAYAFEFGSSRGSRQKDDTVAALMERNNL